MEEARCRTFIALPESPRRSSSVRTNLRLLQEMGANLRELPLLFGGDDRLGLVQTVGDEVVQLLPTIDLQRQEPKLVSSSLSLMVSF